MSTLIDERWRPIAGTNGWYEVSDQGRVRSWKSLGRSTERMAEPRILAQRVSGLNKHRKVNLTVGGILTTPDVHAIAAEAFLGTRPEGTYIRHKNGDLLDNRLANLEYAVGKGGGALPGERHWNAKLSEREVGLIRLALAGGATQAAIAERVGVSPNTIYNIKNGKNWSHVA